jgi:small subunit ribosomal protein S9
MENKYTYAVGRRKTASAQVRLFEGKGNNTINGKDASEYVARGDLFDVVYAPLKAVNSKDKYYFEVKVNGSGESAQAQAISLGIARALAETEEFKATLKGEGLLTRDSRRVERKKPGKHKARKSSQWSKR